MSWYLLVPPIDVLITVPGVRVRLSSFAYLCVMKFSVALLSINYEGVAAAGPAHNLLGTLNTEKRLAELLSSVIGLLKSVYLRKNFLWDLSLLWTNEVHSAQPRCSSSAIALHPGSFI